MTSNYDMNQNANDDSMLDKKGVLQKGMHHNHQTNNNENRNELNVYCLDYEGSVWTSRVVFGGWLSR